MLYTFESENQKVAANMKRLEACTNQKVTDRVRPESDSSKSESGPGPNVTGPSPSPVRVRQIFNILVRVRI